MEEKTVIITGGNSGLGFECARAIASSNQNWQILIASRNEEKAIIAINKIKSENSEQKISMIKLDLSSLQSVKEFASTFKQANFPPLMGLICNAGIMVREGIKSSSEGYELTFAVNHLGHFYLTNLLIDKLEAKSRIVVVSSNMHNSVIREGKMAPAEFLGGKVLAKTDSENTLKEFQRYTTSKLCNMLFTYELNRRLIKLNKNITVNAFDPGFAPGTGLMEGGGTFRNFIMKSWFVKMIMGFMGIVTSSPKKSGRAMARLLLDSRLQNKTGKYFQIHNEINSSPESYDTKLASELWENSIELADMEDDELQI
jgi:NAD(P)-dependent dehydrogenase (short-subunit alcohol dehydrogenase family)